MILKRIVNLCGDQRDIGGLRCSSGQATTTNAGKLEENETILQIQERDIYRRTNLAAMSISMLVDRPHIRTPRPQKNKAVWLALFRPNTLHRRPYSGVKLHVARRYLGGL